MADPHVEDTGDGLQIWWVDLNKQTRTADNRRSSLAVTWECYELENRWFDFPQRLGIFLFTTASKTALGPTQPPIQGVRGSFLRG
jgi:hypothetical protein